MTRILTFDRGCRLLVFAPHPDDETIATGELIQLALAAGGAVRVVFATDGDNNPWPQRWTERRWRIDARDRERWGARRRAEALAALSALGVPAGSARFLGWPDLGLTHELENAAAIDTLAAEVAAFAPTHVAMPSLRDTHPDHGALRVMGELALAKAGSRCTGLGYAVHGRDADAGAWLLPRDRERHARKREALMAHASQVSLSRRRLLRWASAPESFEHIEPRSSAARPRIEGSVLTIPLSPPHRFWRRHDVLVLLADGDTLAHVRVALPRVVRGTHHVLARGACGGRVTIELADGMLRIVCAPGDFQGYVKLERSAPRLFIFDVETWRSFADFPDAPPHAARVETVAVPQRASP
ncbi:MAG TPA: PIG-L family deacetylase [Rhodanobacteraceae bacterium]|nr:PIG-L family deacetylase [Rhodanobacteraceae bacterium]